MTRVAHITPVVHIIPYRIHNSSGTWKLIQQTSHVVYIRLQWYMRVLSKKNAIEYTDVSRGTWELLLHACLESCFASFTANMRCGQLMLLVVSESHYRMHDSSCTLRQLQHTCFVICLRLNWYIKRRGRACVCFRLYRRWFKKWMARNRVTQTDCGAIGPPKLNTT